MDENFLVPETEEQKKYNQANELVEEFFKNPKKYCLERKTMIFNKAMDDIYSGWIRYAEPQRKKPNLQKSD